MSSAYREALLLTAAEVRELVGTDERSVSTLNAIVKLIARRFEADVCSVYLLEPDRSHLILAANVGLRPDCVGKLRMTLREGLAGLVAEQLRPVAVEQASLHPRFKHFANAGEDAYHSFLGVPLIDQGLLQGVLVVQTIEARDFTEVEVRTLIDASEHLGPLVAEARTLEQFVAPIQARLWAVARNLWWCWNSDVATLFRELDPIRWRELDHNPIALLSEMSLKQIEARAGQLVLHNRINQAFHRLQEYLKSQRTWGATYAGVLKGSPVAYFSAEFGLHESVPIYSGGLGVLAGDHVKSASDLGVPLIGVGLFYDQGYFRQRLDSHGWQQEDYLDVNVSQLPVQPALDAKGEPLQVDIQTRMGQISARVWKAAVGRCELLLLDSDVPGNAPEDRELTARLYGGDNRVRIRQELLLGVGGVRALRGLGIRPGVLHLNEGHSAFAALEMIRQRMVDDGLTRQEAAREVAAQTCFTTHTPVPAGHDRFNSQLIAEHLGPLAEAIGLEHEQLMGLGRVDVDNVTEDFCMTVLALKSSRRANAVSALHGRVSRHMWTSLWPDRPEEETPIGHITNGVHVHTWLASQMHHLYDRYLGHDWPRRAANPHTWEPIEQIDDGELWETHLTLKSRLIEFVRRRAVRQAERRGEQKDFIRKLERALTPDALTIGFARRFATYKRANLALLETDTIAALVNDPQHPIQLVFAGKAHPRDEPGKRVLQQIARMAREPEFIGKIVFVEDYDINIGRHLTQGVDVWLNNPRRPLEASGTSGQKVVLNGGLNFSVLDGWWAEAYDGSNGFAIGLGQTHVDPAIHDARDAEALMKTLREQVIPLYYRRDESGLPRAWIARIKRAIQTLGWRFHSDRMVMDYVLNCYLPAVGGTSCVMPK